MMLLEQSIIHDDPAGWNRADVVGVIGMNGGNAQVAGLPATNMLDPYLLNRRRHTDHQNTAEPRNHVHDDGAVDCFAGPHYVAKQSPASRSHTHNSTMVERMKNVADGMFLESLQA